MDEKEFLQEFIDFLKGVESLEFCYESNDLESDQQFNRTCKTDRELVSSFLFSRQPSEARHWRPFCTEMAHPGRIKNLIDFWGKQHPKKFTEKAK